MLASACKQLQALSLQVPDSRFKIQDPKRTSWIQAAGFKIQDFQWLSLNPGACIQDWRFKISVAFLESRGLGTRFKIQDSKRTSRIQGGGFKIQDFQWLFLNPGAWIQDSRFKIQDPKRTSWIQTLYTPLWKQTFFLHLESWIQAPGFKKSPWKSWILNPPPWIQEVLFWILNLQSWIQAPGFKKSIWKYWILNPPPSIQEILFGSWIFNLVSKPLDSRRATENLESWILPPGFKKFFLDLESWILCPSPWIQEKPVKILNLESTRWIQEVLFRSWILNLESCIQALDSRKNTENLESWILPPGFKRFFLDLESETLNPGLGVIMLATACKRLQACLLH